MTLFLQQWTGELMKLFARRRTYIGFGAFVVLELVLLLLFRLQGMERFLAKISGKGAGFAHYQSALTLAMFVLGLSVLILGALYICLVGGDIVAKENEDGHYRLLLARPVSRVRLLFVKYLTCVSYAIVLIQFITWSVLLLGIVLMGWGGGFFAWVPELGLMVFYEWGPGFQRFAMASVFLAISMTTVSSIAFFLSCMPIKPAAATIGALSYVLIDWILRGSNFMDSYEHLLITTHMGAWHRILTEHIPWAIVIRSYAVLTGVSLSLFVLGAAVFEARDLKS
jgi:ABC-2 type transport system permease protein